MHISHLFVAVVTSLKPALISNDVAVRFQRDFVMLTTSGLYRATELHVPKAMIPPRPQETTFGVLFAQQATWHVSIMDAAIFTVEELPLNMAVYK